MVTRIDARGLQGISGGNAPIQKIEPAAVDYMPAARQAALADESLAKTINSLTEILFKQSENLRTREAERFLVENPITNEQLEQLIKGHIVKLGGGIGDKNNFFVPSVFNEVVRKGRAAELSSLLTGEFLNLGLDEVKKIENNQTSVASAQAKLNSALKGYQQTIGNIDGDASRQFAAAAVLRGNTIIAKGHEIEAKRLKEKNQIRLKNMIDDDIDLVKKIIERGDIFPDSDSSDYSQYISVEKQLAYIKNHFLETVLALGSSSDYEKMRSAFDSAVNTAKIDVMINYVTDPDKNLSELEIFRMFANKNIDGQSAPFSRMWQEMSDASRAKVRTSVRQFYLDQKTAVDRQNEEATIENEKKLNDFIGRIILTGGTDRFAILGAQAISELYPRIITQQQLKKIIEDAKVEVEPPYKALDQIKNLIDANHFANKEQMQNYARSTGIPERFIYLDLSPYFIGRDDAKVRKAQQSVNEAVDAEGGGRDARRRGQIRKVITDDINEAVAINNNLPADQRKSFKELVDDVIEKRANLSAKQRIETELKQLNQNYGKYGIIKKTNINFDIDTNVEEIMKQFDNEYDRQLIRETYAIIKRETDKLYKPVKK